MAFFIYFQNAVISQSIGGFLCSTPEMKAMDAYVPFPIFKSLNNNQIRNYFAITFSKNIKLQILPTNLQGYYIFYISQDNSEISFLFSDLNARNGTYASLAFISGSNIKIHRWIVKLQHFENI